MRWVGAVDIFLAFPLAVVDGGYRTDVADKDQSCRVQLLIILLKLELI